MIITPIEMLKERINKLALGILAKSEYAEGNNEISDIINATNCLAEGLQKTSDFAQSIGEGNFDINFKPLSSHDILGNALLNMRQSLKNAKEHEVIRKQEEQLSKWAADGRSQFGEIIRSSDNLKNVSNLLISNMVKYINANQGGVFVYNDDVVGQENIELVAAYAYNRKKHLKKIIPKDDGLLWTSVHEKTSIYITEVPKDYAEIKSGLGSAYPTCILIVPLVVNERVEGLFELASFHPMEDYKIQFVEKIAESAATNFASIKMNKKTNELLKKTRDEAEIMQAQEEELRFKIDTLQRLEIQSQRTERQLQTQISKLLYLLDNHGIDIPEEFRTAEYNREEKEEI